MPEATDYVIYIEEDIACPTCAGTVSAGFQNYTYADFLTWSGAGNQVWCPTCSGYFDITTWSGTLELVIASGPTTSQLISSDRW